MNHNSRLAARPSFDERDLTGVLAEIASVLRSGRLILGEHTAALEEEFARAVGAKHAIAVSSCSAALEIALRAVGARGREVIVPTNTFTATATAAIRAAAGDPVLAPAGPRSAALSPQAGGRVTFSECDEHGNFSVVDALTRLSADTAAIVAVHVAGFIPHDFDLLIVECNRRGIALIEDCAHAHGATLGSRVAGSLGDVGCFSFYPTKILTCGVGGMVTTNRDDVARLARSLRHHGQGASLEELVAVGSDYLMDEVRAVLCRAQLRRLPKIIAHRRKVAAAYQEALDLTSAKPKWATPPAVAPGTGAVYYKYPVQLAEGLDAAAVRQRMADRGIAVGGLYWPPVHQMPLFAPLGVKMPRSEAVLRRRLCLPMHGQVDPADCREIVETLMECIGTRETT